MTESERNRQWKASCANVLEPFDLFFGYHRASGKSKSLYVCM